MIKNLLLQKQIYQTLTICFDFFLFFFCFTKIKKTHSANKIYIGLTVITFKSYRPQRHQKLDWLFSNCKTPKGNLLCSPFLYNNTHAHT